MERPWTSEQVPALADWVEQNSMPLDFLVEAAALPRYFSPSPSMLDASENRLIAMLLPNIQMMRTALRALQIRAMWHLGEGRTSDAWQDMLACHRLARLTSVDCTLVGQLVAIAIDGVACSNTVLLLHHANMGADRARQVFRDIDRLGSASSCLRSLDQGERLFFLDASLALARSNGGLSELFDYGMLPEQLAVIMRTRVDWNMVLRIGNSWYDRLVAAARLTSREQRSRELDGISQELRQLVAFSKSPSAWIGSALNKKRRSELASHLLLASMLPATSAACDAEDRGKTQLELTRIAAALAVYRAEQGNYPQQLTGLVPALLRQLPIDLYSGKPFLYRRKDDGGYLLYSVFENGTDDGGTVVGGHVIDGEWASPAVDEQPTDRNSEKSDLVIRVPVPKFKFPPPPRLEDLQRNGFGGAYGE